MLKVIAALVSLLVVAPSSLAAAPDRVKQAVDQAVARGTTALAAKRFEDAAAAMEEAFALDNDPLWAANAGYAWLQAGQPARAIEWLTKALGDARFKGDAAKRAEERLGAAKALVAAQHVARAEAAKGRRELDAAAEALEAADALTPSADYRREAAELRAQAQAARDKAVRDAREADAKAKLKGRVDEPSGGDSNAVLGWVLVGGGAAVAGFGAVSFALMDGARGDFAAKVDGDDYDGTRAEAEAQQRTARTWWTVGWIASVAGVAAGTIGAVVLLSDDGPETRGTVQVGGAATPDGGLVTVMGRF